MASNYKSVEKNAFLKQTTITAVSFGEKCKTVEESAFADCSELSNINPDNEIITICSNAFTHTSIINVTFNSVETIGNSAFEGCKCLKYITINNGCSFIGDYAFRDCETLTSVDIPNNENFKTISNGTFENCCSIKEISIPKYITTIGSSAFNGCGNLSSVIFDPGSQVENIGNFAFRDCSSITEISIPNTTTNIGYGAFYECKSLTSVMIGTSVRTIQGEAFNGCIGLTNINIPNSVTTIEKEAFARCSGLTTISIGSGITTIGSGAFLNCNKLKNVYTNDIASWCNIDFTNIKSNPLHVGGNLCLNNDPNTKLNITLPSDGVKKYAFYNCKNISNITIPNEFTSDKFGKEAFHGVVSHRVINLSNDITVSKIHGENGCVGENAQEIINAYNGEIHDEIFVFGQKSQNINSDWALFKYLGTEEIYNSKYKDGLILPDKDYTYDINEGVFKDHTEIKNITISTDVTSIGNYTFNGCSGLITLTINGYDYDNSDSESESEIDDTKPVVYKMEMDGSESEIEPELILGYNRVDSYIGGDGLFKFENCKLTTLNLGRNISYNTKKEYGYSPFSGILSLTMVNIGDDVTNINENMFYNCRNISSVNIGNSVKNIGDSAFHYCSKIESITIPNSVTSIGELAFSNCSLTKGVYIKSLAAWCNIDFKYQPDSDDYKYDSNPLCKSGGKLYLNGNLVEGDIVIPKGVKNIGFCTFYGCGIESVTIPDSVRSIGERAFNWCSNLTSVTLGNNVNSIGNDAFANCGNIKIYINGSTIPGSWCKINFANKGANPASISGGLYNIENKDDEEKNKPIENIIIPNDVTKIGSYAFYNFKYTKSIIIPNSVTSIGEGAFKACKNDNNQIKRIVIGNGINTIGSKAFGDIGDVDIIIIGKDTPLINDKIYDANNYLNEPILINFSQNNYKSGFGDLYPNNIYDYPDAKRYGDFMFDSKNNSHTLCGYMGVGVGALKLPNYYGNLYAIGDYVFYNCDMLTDVTIPNYVTSIGKQAFSGCSGLERIVVEAGNENYDSRNNCNAIIETDSNTLIQGCKNTIIPEDVTTIGNFAFYNCDTLTSITIPSSVKEIEKYAFWGCKNLKTVINRSPYLTIKQGYDDNGYVGKNADVITNSNDTTTEIYEDFIFNIDEKTLIGYTGNETELILPESYKGYNYKIGNYALENNKNITSVTIPNSVTSIGTQAFENCSNLNIVMIGNNVTIIESSAFKGCGNLTTVINLSSHLTIEKGYDDNGYVGKNANKVINAPNGYIEGDFVFGKPNGVNTLVAYIGNDKEITLPSNYNGENYVIGESVFENNKTITKIIITYGVTSIGDNAFLGCENLKTVINHSSSFTIEKGSVDNGYVGKYAETVENTYIQLDENFVFEVSEGVIILKSYKGTEQELVLPTSYHGENYVIGASAFENKTITSITIPNSVTSIGREAFYNCFDLTAVYISDLTAWCNIDFEDQNSNPLYWSENLYLNKNLVKNLVIPDDIKHIKDYTFIGCTSLTSVEISNSVTSIGDEAFCGCSGLTSITIPNSVTSIGNSALDATAWYDNQRNGVMYAGKVLYSYKGDIPENTSINIEEGTLGIANSAFQNDNDGRTDNLISIIIPNSMKNIGTNAFKGCENLKTVINCSSLYIQKGFDDYGYVGKYADRVIKLNVPYYTIDGNFVWSKISNNNTLCAYIGDDYYEENFEVELPENYNEENYVIGESVFRDCINLINVTIPNSVTSIGNYAFDGCYNLTSVTIPNSVTSIGNYAFGHCSHYIDDYNSDYGLENVIFNDGSNLENIGDYAFYDCDYIKNISIPNKVNSIGNYAFSHCDGLAKITLPTNISTISNHMFDKCITLDDITIPNGVTNIGNYAFHECSSLTSVTIPNSVTSIESYAFDGCSRLTSVTIGNSVTSIGERAFYGCSRLTSVTIPNSVTTIDDEAFSNCGSLNKVTIGNDKDTKIEYINSKAFYNTSKINNRSVLQRVELYAIKAPYIGQEVFYINDITADGDISYYRTKIHVLEDSSGYDTSGNANWHPYYNNSMIKKDL